MTSKVLFCVPIKMRQNKNKLAISFLKIQLWTICSCVLVILGLFEANLVSGSRVQRDNLVTFDNVTSVAISNHTDEDNFDKTNRNTRQLFSLLKNLLGPQRQPQQTQQDPVQQQTPAFQQQDYYYKQQQMQNPYESQYPGAFSASSVEQKIHSAHINPEYQHQYPMLNYPSQQHNTVPMYNDNLQQQQQLFQQTVPNPNPNVGGGGSSNPSNPLLTLLSSVIGAGAGGGSANNAMVSSMLSKLGLGLPEDLDLGGLLNFGSIEGMIGRVNRFDKLQCIPRMICQMVSKRNEDARIKASTSTTTSTTTTTTTERSSKKSSKSKKKSRQDSGRFIKIDGVDTALDQFVKFLDMMQLKDWSLYPYVKGMTEGHQARQPGECADRFRSCPFSEDQLVYYFNNYNGGFFQSFRSGRNSQSNSTAV